MKSWLLYKPQDFFPSLRDEAEVDTLLNNDVYKFFMLDFILAHPEYVGTPVRWKMTIRNRDIATAKVFSQEKLERQLKMTREKIQGVSESDLSYLRGMTNTQWKRLFREETLKFLSEFRLPDFQITQVWNNYQMTFEGAWENSMMWEIFALKIVNSLYISEYIKKEEISDAEFTHIINQVLTRLFDDIKILKALLKQHFLNLELADLWVRIFKEWSMKFSEKISQDNMSEQVTYKSQKRWEARIRKERMLMNSAWFRPLS